MVAEFKKKKTKKQGKKGAQKKKARDLGCGANQTATKYAWDPQPEAVARDELATYPGVPAAEFGGDVLNDLSEEC